MINDRIQKIFTILDKFIGKDGEPENEIEFYILKSMWVMMLSEFEGSVKDVVEAHLVKMRSSKIEEIHICLLLQNFYPNAEDKLTMKRIISVHKEDPRNIHYGNFTRDSKPKYKSRAIEKLFNNLGIFFSEEELISLKALDGIASTRDSIAHGDRHIQITKKELEERFSNIEDIFQMLKGKLLL